MKVGAVLALVLVGLVLGTILWPSGPRGIGGATGQCMSNAKQQAYGLIQYAADHDDRFPPERAWMDGAVKYAKIIEILQDPVPPMKGYGYAFNAGLSTTITPNTPEIVPMTYDSTNRLRNASDFVTSLPILGHHGGKNAVSFADGRVRMIAPTKGRGTLPDES